MTVESVTNCALKYGAAVAQQHKVRRIFDSWRQFHRDHAGPERIGKTPGCLLACWVGVQHRVQALPLAEQLLGRWAETRPAQSQTGHAPLMQRQQIERTLDDADAAAIAPGLIPTQ